MESPMSLGGLAVLASIVGQHQADSAATPTRPLSRYVRHYEPVHGDFTDVERQHRRRRDTDRSPLRITLNTHGKEHTLLLKEEKWANVLSAHDAVYYAGHVEGQTGTYAHGYFRDGAFDGVIHTPHETYFIEKSSKYFGNTSTHPMVAYKQSDVIHDPSYNHQTCASDVLQTDKDNQVPNGNYSRPRRNVEFNQMKNTCRVKLVADHTYFRYMGTSTAAVKQELISILKEVDLVYSNHTFLSETPVHVALSDYDPITVYESKDSYPLELAALADERATDATDILHRFSRGNWNPYCLAHLFSHREYSGGVLGLAWVGKADASTLGGICQSRAQITLGGNQDSFNLNTGLNTNIILGTPVIKAVNIITVAHEIGHNFGAEHDPNTMPCTGDPRGNYIMFPRATDLKATNNRKFSPCSIEQISRTLYAKGECFSDYPDAVCGNGVVEGKEECDSGTSKDPCCNPDCTLADIAVCSRNDACCNSQCGYANSTVLCKEGGECTTSTYCDGASKTCPSAQKKPDTTSCGSQNSVLNAYLCSSGVCTKEYSSNQVTVCGIFPGAVPCYTGTCAQSGTDQCRACCVFPNTRTCQSVEHYCKNAGKDNPACLNGTRRSVFVGQPCENSNGYCAANATCQIVNFDTPNALGVQDAKTFFEYTWYYLVAGLGVFAVVFAIYTLVSRVCPSERRLRRMAIEQRYADAAAVRKSIKSLKSKSTQSLDSAPPKSVKNDQQQSNDLLTASSPNLSTLNNLNQTSKDALTESTGEPAPKGRTIPGISITIDASCSSQTSVLKAPGKNKRKHQSSGHGKHHGHRDERRNGNGDGHDKNSKKASHAPKSAAC